MELVGEQLVNAPRPMVWSAINDPDILSRCIPGCEAVSLISPTEREARVMLKIGPVRARFSGRILMSDIVEPSGCRMSFEGTGGAAGFAKGGADVALTEEGAQTRLRYTVSASVGGKLGQIGGRLIDASARKVADEFFTALDAALTHDLADDRADPAVTGDVPDVGTAVSAPVVGGASLAGHSALAAPAGIAGTAAAPRPANATNTARQFARPLSDAHAPAQTSLRTALAAEFSRVLWFCLGVGTTLLSMHFAR